MGAKKQTIGYHYLMSVLFGLCRGPVNELVTIEVGEEEAWGGNLCTSQAQYINQPDLFGGKKKEGGIQGPFRLLRGFADQVLPGSEVSAASFSKEKKQIADTTLPGIKETIGGNISEFRGVVTLWFDGLISSLNPYPKQWKFRLRRTTQGWFQDISWYPEKATIFLDEGRVHAMNAAHILYQTETDPTWGRGRGASELDDNSFTLAANTLCAEGLGLCLVWYRKDDIDNFQQTVLDHIGGVLYTDRETGKINLKLIRDDYAIEDLPHFTPESGLLEIVEDDSQSSETAYSEVIVTGHSPLTDDAIQGRFQNLAAREAFEAPAPLALDYPGLPTTELCDRVAARDGRIHAAGLKKYDVRLDRRAWRLTPGSVIRVSDPRRNIANAVLRLGEIDDGKMVDGEIRVKALQDVFGLPATAFVKPVESTWTPPSRSPEYPVALRSIEAGYRDLYLRLDASELGAVTEEDAYLGQLVAPANTISPEYDLFTRAEGEVEFEEYGSHGYTGSAVLVVDVEPLDTVLTLTSISNFPDAADMIGDAVMIDDEIVRVDGWDPATKELTVARGTADTLPARHAAEARVWLIDDDMGTDQRVYVSGETVYVKSLPRTSAGVYPFDDAGETSVTMAGRLIRPYPPADVRVDGDSIFALSGLYTEPTLTWVGRNRVTQADHLLGHGEAGVAEEAGTTYTVEVYDPDGGLLNTYAGVSSGWQYDSVKQGNDGASGTVRLRLFAVRDGHESRAYDEEIVIPIISGYGYGYGLNYGGTTP